MMIGAAVICLVPLLAAAEGLAVLWAEDTGHVSAVVPAFGGDGLWLGFAHLIGGRRLTSTLSQLTSMRWR
jgi:hypothetical protein